MHQSFTFLMMPLVSVFDLGLGLNELSSVKHQVRSSWAVEYVLKKHLVHSMESCIGNMTLSNEPWRLVSVKASADDKFLLYHGMSCASSIFRRYLAPSSAWSMSMRSIDGKVLSSRAWQIPDEVQVGHSREF